MKIVRYTRVSTKQQSIEGQKLEIDNFCKNNKYTITHNIDVDGVSGKDNIYKRKIWNLQNLLNQGDTVIVTEFSRLGRTFNDVMKLLIWFREHKINLILTNQPNVDITTDFGVYMATTLVFVAIQEIKQLDERRDYGIKQMHKEGRKGGLKLGQRKTSICEPHKDTVVRLRKRKWTWGRIANKIGVGLNTINVWKKRKIEDGEFPQDI